MPYVIGHITVKDPAKWAEYRAQVPATVAPHGTGIAVRINDHQLLEKLADTSSTWE